MRVVVTGGAGNIGQWVVRELRQQTDGRAAHAVTVVDRVSGPAEAGVRYLLADVEDLGQVVGALAGAEAVIHLAGINRPGVRTDEVTFRCNVMSTFNVHEAAWRLGIRRVVSTSSEAALGWEYRERDFVPEYLPLDEDHPARPQDPYGLSKLVGEAIARSYADKCGMETVVLRPPWVVMPERMEQLSRDGGRPLTRFGPSTYVDVRDLAVAFRLAIEQPVSGGVVIFTVADDSTAPGPLEELFPRLLPAIGDLAHDLTETRPAVSNARARQLLGWQPRRSWRRAADGPDDSG